MGYRLAEVGEIRPKEFRVWANMGGWWPSNIGIGEPVLIDHNPVAVPADTFEPFPIQNDHRDQPLYQSILDRIDAHDSATRCERADRVYAEAMRMIGGG